MEEKKVLLSVKDLHVKFHVRGRTLTAIRGISLDFYEGESIAIVGESGSGKSVFTKTFAGMLDSNGFISEGSIIFNDEELSDTKVKMTSGDHRILETCKQELNAASKLEYGAQTMLAIEALEAEKEAKLNLSPEEEKALTGHIDELAFKRTELFNVRQTVDSKHEKERYKQMGQQIKEMDEEIKVLQKKREETIAAHKKAVHEDTAYQKEFSDKMAALKAQYEQEIQHEITDETKARNEKLAKEIVLSVGRFDLRRKSGCAKRLLAGLKNAMKHGKDLTSDQVLNAIFDEVTFRVAYLDESGDTLHGKCILNLAKVHFPKDWTQIRGGKIATVFQDPMTSLNPIITIGKQITSVILQHQDCSELEARARLHLLCYLPPAHLDTRLGGNTVRRWKDRGERQSCFCRGEAEELAARCCFPSLHSVSTCVVCALLAAATTGAWIPALPYDGRAVRQPYEPW